MQGFKALVYCRPLVIFILLLFLYLKFLIL